MIPQQPSDDHRQHKHPMQILLLLLFVALLLWMLSTMNIVQDIWATALNVLFSGLGTILALLQWNAQAHLGSSVATMLPPTDKVLLRGQFVQDIANKRKGAILIYASRKWRGTTLHLLPGLEGTAEAIEAASNIVERHIGGQRQFLGHFPAVSPGRYTLVAHSRRRSVQVTVYPGHLSEIDWR